jgi:predicted Rdx family selenoprotein
MFLISSLSDTAGNAGSPVSSTTDGSFVIVVDSCFDTVWERVYDGAGEGFDQSRGITSDSFGNAYVTGWTSGGYYYDFITIKYDQDGNIVPPWPMTYDSGYGNDYAHGVCVDGNNDVYVTGHSYSGMYPGTTLVNNDFVAIKYSNDGTELWVNQDDFGKIEYAKSITVGESGNFYVAGDSWNGSYHDPDYDYLTVKYESTTGNVLWWNTWDNESHGADDSPRGVAADGDGDVYVTGASLNASDDHDAVTVKYSSACSGFDPVLPGKCADSEVWARVFDSGYDDAAYAIAADTIGGEHYIYVTGETFNGLDYDLVLIKYAADGMPVWERAFDGGFDDAGAAVTVDDAHAVYVAGEYDNGIDVDYITLKYDEDGVLLNSWVFNSGYDDSAKGVTTSGTDVYVTGTYWPSIPKDNSDFMTVKYVQDCDPFRITTPFLKGAMEGVPYSQSLVAVSGSGPYTWSVSYGYLPAGLTLDQNTGVVLGVPSELGTFSFTVHVEDSSLPTPLTAAKTFTILVGGVTITSTSLPFGTVGSGYIHMVEAAGWPTPLTWSVVGGSLPVGLRLGRSTGVISGTPSLAGTYSFSVRVTSPYDVSDTATFTVEVVNPLRIATSSLPLASVGTAYSESSTAYGGKSPYTWTVTSGALPDGLVLNSATGLVSGIPTTAGLFTFSLQVSDLHAATAVKSLSISVDPFPPLAVVSETPVYYSSIQNAYAAAEDGDVLKIRALEFAEELDFDRNIVVTLDGGYDATFTEHTGLTTISGSVTVNMGEVLIEGDVLIEKVTVQ